LGAAWQQAPVLAHLRTSSTKIASKVFIRVSEKKTHEGILLLSNSTTETILLPKIKPRKCFAAFMVFFLFRKQLFFSPIEQIFPIKHLANSGHMDNSTPFVLFWQQCFY